KILVLSIVQNPIFYSIIDGFLIIYSTIKSDYFLDCAKDDLLAIKAEIAEALSEPGIDFIGQASTSPSKIVNLVIKKDTRIVINPTPKNIETPKSSIITLQKGNTIENIIEIRFVSEKVNQLYQGGKTHLSILIKLVKEILLDNLVAKIINNQGKKSSLVIKKTKIRLSQQLQNSIQQPYNIQIYLRDKRLKKIHINPQRLKLIHYIEYLLLNYQMQQTDSKNYTNYRPNRSQKQPHFSNKDYYFQFPEIFILNPKENFFKFPLHVLLGKFSRLDFQ
ncbi:hypothetical protein IMG5_143280, partial [Ichthyophthirius multifiliis]